MPGSLTESELMRGGCYALARRLSERTGLPVWGLADEDDVVHHAFVHDEGSGTAYDARGSTSLSTVGRSRWGRCAGSRPRPMAGDEVERYVAETGHWLTRGGIDGFVRRTPTLRDLVVARRASGGRRRRRVGG